MSEPTVLEYAKGHSRWPRRLRRAVAAMMVLGLLFAAWHWHRDISQHVSAWYWQGQCANFTLPPGELMVAMDPAAARMSLPSPPWESWRIAYTSTTGAARHIAAADNLLDVAGLRSMIPPKPSVIFVHERIAAAPGGKPRLVMVALDARTYAPLPGFEVIVLSEGSLFRLPQNVSPGTRAAIGLNLGPQPDPDLRIYAGQPDPADPSHFTIDYEMWGQRDTFDGWLQPDDTVRLKPRSRPMPPPKRFPTTFFFGPATRP